MSESRLFLGLRVGARRAVLAARLLSLLTGAAGLTVLWHEKHQTTPESARIPVAVQARRSEATELKPVNLSARPVYPLSVIPGGAYTQEELARARRVDRVVARHYAAFAPQPRFERAGAPLLAYVSYRRRDQIFWTRKPRRIPQGELLMIDGARMARARCGNQLALNPQSPTEPTEPDEDLDSPRKLADLPEIRLPNEPILPELADADSDILGPPLGPVLKPVLGSPATNGPFGLLTQPLILGGFGRLPAAATPTQAAASLPASGSSPSATSSDSATPGASSGVPSVNPPVSLIPEPSSSKLMLPVLVLCIVLLRIRKSAGTE